jgi:hypothetical protein
MSRWDLQRERRRQRRKALLLRALADAVRPVDMVIRYRGTERLVGTLSSDSDVQSFPAVAFRRSIWTTDIRHLWKSYRQGAAPELPPNSTPVKTESGIAEHTFKLQRD